jgi:hypothetical protein
MSEPSRVRGRVRTGARDVKSPHLCSAPSQLHEDGLYY